MSLRERLDELRRQRGWTMNRLAVEAKVPYPTVWRLEKGQIKNPKLDLLTKLATALGVSVDELTQGVGRQLSLLSDLFPDDPYAEGVFRGYGELPERTRREVRNFVQFLAQQEAEAQRRPVEEDRKIVD